MISGNTTGKFCFISIFNQHLFPEFGTFLEIKFWALINNDLYLQKTISGCPAFLDLFFGYDTAITRAGLNDLNWKFTLVLFGVPEIIGAGGKYQKPPGGASARSQVSLRYEMYKAMVRYSQCS